jgi:hypothetical protein
MSTGEGQVKYAIAGSYTEYIRWDRPHAPEARIVYLIPERAQQPGRPKGQLHRIAKWEKSPVLQYALEPKE